MHAKFIESTLYSFQLAPIGIRETLLLNRGSFHAITRWFLLPLFRLPGRWNEKGQQGAHVCMCSWGPPWIFKISSIYMPITEIYIIWNNEEGSDSKNLHLNLNISTKDSWFVSINLWMAVIRVLKSTDGIPGIRRTGLSQEPSSSEEAMSTTSLSGNKGKHIKCNVYRMTMSESHTKSLHGL